MEVEATRRMTALPNSFQKFARNLKHQNSSPESGIVTMSPWEPSASTSASTYHARFTATGHGTLTALYYIPHFTYAQSCLRRSSARHKSPSS